MRGGAAKAAFVPVVPGFIVPWHRGVFFPAGTAAGDFNDCGGSDRAGDVYDEKAKALLDAKILNAIADKLAALEPFNAETIQNTCKQIADETGGKLGQIAMPFRAALTGTTVSPSIFHAAEILGRDETLARLKAAA